jgi:hypothetical protein
VRKSSSQQGDEGAHKFKIMERAGRSVADGKEEDRTGSGGSVEGGRSFLSRRPTAGLQVIGH